MPRPALLVLALLALLAGCVGERAAQAPQEVVEALADTRAMDWSKGNWWAYAARVENVSFDMALIVHEARPDSFQLATNLSAGFFGLPWSGNVSGDLNPRIGPDEWTLFDFPLEDGKSWSYSILGYEAKALARAATFHVPGVGPTAGFRIEATSYGQTFARYNYVPDVGWFTRLQLIEPTDGHVVLDAQLTSFGTSWDSAYYVEEVLREIIIEYPAAPGSLSLDIPSGPLQVRASITASAAPGFVDAQLADAAGRALAAARVVGTGVDAQRATARPEGETTWTLRHAGAGLARLHVELTGLSAVGPLAAPAQEAPEVSLGRVLQSTRPAWPHEGQTTSTALPVDV